MLLLSRRRAWSVGCWSRSRHLSALTSIPHPGTVAERPRDAAVHAVDGDIRAIAQVGTRVVIGGTFTKVGPVTRGAVGVVDTAGKTFQPGFPDVVGVVTAVASDGAGGWYLGGTFSSVGGQPRTNLAQVDASGAVTSFAPQPNAPVTRAAAPAPAAASTSAAASPP